MKEAKCYKEKSKRSQKEHIGELDLEKGSGLGGQLSKKVVSWELCWEVDFANCPRRLSSGSQRKRSKCLNRHPVGSPHHKNRGSYA